MLDILTIHGGLCQDEKDQVTALGYSLDPSEFAATVWGLGHPRFCLCDTATLQPVAVFGASPAAKGVYRMWMFTLEDSFRQYGKDITQNVGHVMMETFKELDARRFEITVLARRLLAQRWYVKLGFVKESVLRGFGAEDFVMYSYCGDSP